MSLVPKELVQMVVPGVNTPQSGEDSLKLNELMELCTKLQQRVLDLETTNTTQALEIDSLKRRVKKLERERGQELIEDASKQGRIADIDADEVITLVSTQDDAKMFDADKDLHGEEVFVAQQDENVAEKKVDAAQLKHAKPKAKVKGIVFHKAKESTTTTTAVIPKPKSQDKDYQLAKRLQAKEQQDLNDEEKATLFMQLLEKRRKFFAAKRVEEKRNKPPTQAQQRTIMCTYLKNIEGKKITDLKNNHMLNDFEREDVETLWKLVKAKYGSTRPEGDYERVLWGDLKVMFDPRVEDEEDEVWKMQQRYNVVRWTQFNSCRVHCLSLQSRHIYMLVEKRYSLTPVTIIDMLNKKLHANYFDKMTYQLLKLVLKKPKNK
nr:hypothetical protein [Tanacetum cinerariifolium]